VLVRIGQEVQEVPRGLEPSSTQTDLVRRFYEAFNAEDLDGFVDTLHPHVELQTARGLRIGLAEARAWATRNPTGDLRQRYVVEDLIEEGNHMVALVRKQWRWTETEALAEEQETAALFTFEGGSIARWQPFTERAEALRAAGVDQ
jgi:ketosteroid isomerase-like protein